MKSKQFNSRFSSIRKEGVSLSAKTLAELVRAAREKGACFRLEVKGFSMSPFIRDKDVVTISTLSDSSALLGKPVAFVHPKTGKLLIHRVVGKQGSGYIIKGDTNLKADGLISNRNILGRVTKIERKGQSVFRGFGPERFPIAFLSKTGLLNFMFWGWKRMPPFFRKSLRRLTA